MREIRFKILVRTSSGKRAIGDLSIDGKVMLKYFKETRCESGDWLQMDPEKVQRGVCLKAIMNSQVP
jgi:hypothetical protein